MTLVSGNMNIEVGKGGFVVLLKSRGLTQRALALALGVTDRTVARWCAGENAPLLYPWQYATACELLQCTPAEFAEFFPEPESAEPEN